MKRLQVLTLSTSVLAAIAFSSVSYAEHHEEKKDRCEAMKMRHAEHIAKYDTDGDGELSDAEKTAMKQARFAEVDTDNSGDLSIEEMSAHHEARREERKAKMKAKHFERIDTDGNGAVSAEEYEAAAKKMDKRKGKKGNGKKDGMKCDK